MKSFLVISLLCVSSQFSQAAGLPSYLCNSITSRGAVFLQLDIHNQTSSGRESNAYTTNTNILKKSNPTTSEQRQFDKLYVVNVKPIFSDFDKSRPVCGDCYYLNFSPYPFYGVPASTLEVTKSVLSLVAGPANQPTLMLKAYTGNINAKSDNMICEKVN